MGRSMRVKMSLLRYLYSTPLLPHQILNGVVLVRPDLKIERQAQILERPHVVGDFEQPAASGAAIDDLGDGPASLATGDTSKGS